MSNDRHHFLDDARLLKEAVKVLGPVDAHHEIAVFIQVRRKKKIPETGTERRRFKTREQLTAAHGAAKKDLDLARNFALGHGLTIQSECRARRWVEASGTASQIGAAFGVEMERVEIAGKECRRRKGPISVPVALKDVIVAILGIDYFPLARPQCKRVRPAAVGGVDYNNAFSPIDIANAYQFPPGDGGGSTIALLEFGGGYTPDDFNTYFTQQGLPRPNIALKFVSDGQTTGANAPGLDDEADLEVMMDIGIVGTIAPAAQIVVYFAPFTDLGFAAAIHAALGNGALPTAISISWGGSEYAHLWSSRANMDSVDAAIQDAAALGIPVFVACGDNGSTEGQVITVDFPSSSPHAVACGGTSLSQVDGNVSYEVVWNSPPQGATGGGVSDMYGKPGYQSAISVPAPKNNVATGGRGIPDVSGFADYSPGYKVRFGGNNAAGGGTSAVAPLWSALIARIAPQLNNPLPKSFSSFLYQNKDNLQSNDIQQGNNNMSNPNGPYSASKGWDPCTGLGSPNGMALLAALRGNPPLQTAATSAGPDAVTTGVIITQRQGHIAPVFSPQGSTTLAPFDKHDWIILTGCFALLLLAGILLWTSTIKQVELINGASPDKTVVQSDTEASPGWGIWTGGDPDKLYLAAQMQLQKQKYDFAAASLITSAGRRELILFIGTTIVLVGCFVLLRGVRDVNTTAQGSFNGASFNIQSASPAVVIVIIGGALLGLATYMQDTYAVTDGTLVPPGKIAALDSVPSISQAAADALRIQMPPP